MVNIQPIAVSEEIEQFDPQEMNEKLTILSGKFGGTCYAKEGYETIIITVIHCSFKSCRSYL